MVAYSEVPEVNALYEEQGRVNQGITLIDAGGKAASYTIVPPPPDPNTMGSPMLMSVSITTIDPSSELMTAIRNALVERDAAITAELTALGVTDAPVRAYATKAEGAR